MEEQIVKLRQGVACDCGGHHIIPQGSVYIVLDSGRLTCPEHQHDEVLLETQLAGAWR